MNVNVAPAEPAAPEPAIPDLITLECDELKQMLLAKNRAYGNSALDPMRVFSRASPEEQILVRLDDKLSRLARGSSGSGMDAEDVVLDLLGYLVLLRVARKRTSSPRPPSAPVDLTPALCMNCKCSRAEAGETVCVGGHMHVFWTATDETHSQCVLAGGKEKATE